MHFCCNQHILRRCWAATLSVAAVTVGALWLTPFLSKPVRNTPHVSNSVAEPDGIDEPRSLVMLAQYTFVGRGGVVARPLRLPPVVVPPVARRLPPVLTSPVVTRLPSVSTMPATDSAESDTKNVESVDSDAKSVEAVDGDTNSFEAMESDTISVEAVESDAKSFAAVDGDTKSFEVVDSDAKSVAAMESDTISVEAVQSGTKTVDSVDSDTKSFEAMGSDTKSTELTESATNAALTPISADVSESCLLPAKVPHDWNDPASVLSAARRQAEQLVRGASALASRGATYSARRELESALVTLSQALDSHSATTDFTQSLRTGLLAMEEAGDFAPSQARNQLNLDVALIVSRHQSHAVSPAEARQWTPVEAARKYFSFAQSHLVAASGGSPVAAHALFGLGKLNANLSESGSAAERLYGPRSMLLHQTALMIDNSHYLAANELGVLLARFGRLNDARNVLRHGLTQGTSPEIWRNLADVHERLGEVELASLARAEWNRISQLSRREYPDTVTAPNGVTVQWVDKATFERGSRELGPKVPTEPMPAQSPHTAVQSPRMRNFRW